METPEMEPWEKRELLKLLQTKDRRLRQNKLAHYRPYLKQKEFHEAGRDHRERLFIAGNQLGKFQRVDEPVLTPLGWVEIGKLAVGDEVISGDGTVTRVAAVFPQGVKPLVEMEFADGQRVISGEEHLWKVLAPAQRFTTKCETMPRQGATRKTKQVPNSTFGQWSVLTTQAMREAYGDSPSPKYRFATPAVGVVQLREKPVAIDPYVLGLLIGDGGLTKGVVFSTADPETLGAFQTEIERHGGRVVHRGKYDWEACACRAFRDELERLELLGKKAAQKAVPREYLWNSPGVRLAVLQGLMDTDGTCEKSGVTTFTSVSEQLAQDVVFLSRSFGAKCKVKSRIPTYAYKGEKKQGQRAYTVTIRLPHADIFRLERKLSRYIRPTSTTDHNLVVAYRDVEPGEAVCIAVEHPDRTYVTKDFIVTHNTWAGAYEVAMHATGRYPEWWQGRRFPRPIRAIVGSESAELTKKGIQRLLLGDPEKREEWGTGTIPKDCLVSTSPRPGVPDAVSSIVVKHELGEQSVIQMSSYEQGRAKWQADTVDLAWMDEESPLEIYSEALTRTQATGGMVFMTFTPLLGMTQVVKRFLHEKPAGSVVTQMTIDDAEHYTVEERKRIIAAYPEHEREARARGIPIMGSGLVFPVAESTITVEPFAIPPHWGRINGLDFGWQHKSAWVALAHDRDTDTVYVYDCWAAKETPVLNQVGMIVAKGQHLVPHSWPHDGLQHDKGSGDQLMQLYKKFGVNMLPERAQFEQTAEGKHGGNSVEAGIAMMMTRFQARQLRVFSHLNDWFQEFRMYHRKDGIIVKADDDIISATRYGLMMLRKAKSLAEVNPQQAARRGQVMMPAFETFDPSVAY